MITTLRLSKHSPTLSLLSLPGDRRQLVFGCGGPPALLRDSGQEPGLPRPAPINNKVDILWVIRNAGLMGPMQTNLATSVNSFMSQFVNDKFDFHIAVVTTDIRPVDNAAPNDPNLSGQDACFVGTPPSSSRRPSIR